MLIEQLSLITLLISYVDSLGQGRLYELFSVTSPAFAAEMAELLSRPEYHNPTTETSPDILEIVKYLLRGTVEYVPCLRRDKRILTFKNRDRTICDALGCSIEALRNSSAPPAIPSQDWLLESLQRAATPGALPFQDVTTIPDTDSIHNQSFPASSPELAELVERDQNLGVQEEDCETQEQSKHQHNTYGDRLEYDWDNGPLELFPSNFVETDYPPDRGPYSPGAFSFDESDPVLGLLYTDIVS